MTSLALLFVGAVLLVNGLVFLGGVDSRSAVPINLLTGAVLVGAALFIALPVRDTEAESLDTLLSAAGFLLFAFTYLTVGINALTGAGGAALGWYCGWAAAIAAISAGVDFFRIDDPRLGWLWLSWAVLFVSFFLALSTRWEWMTKPAGVLALLQSVTTATIPAVLMLTDGWASLPVALLAGVQLLVIAVYVWCLFVARRSAARDRDLVTAGV